MKFIFSVITFLIIFLSCTNEKKQLVLLNADEKNVSSWKTPLTVLSDEQYPDNPDIGLMHSSINNIELDSLRLDSISEFLYTFKFYNKDSSLTVTLDSLYIKEFIPAVQERLKSNEYLSKIAVINQEWNRNQVKFSPKHFKVRGQVLGQNLSQITRIDIARNCLNSYLWEVAFYTIDSADSNLKEKPCYHAWFSFPKKLFSSLFEQVNQIPFSKYSSFLENWEDPEQEVIDISKLRTVFKANNTSFNNFNAKSYLKIGERSKKYKNIIVPQNTTVINDFLNDSTLFATFTPPGFYNTKTPRVTFLSKIKRLDKIIKRTIVPISLASDTLLELELIFNSGDTINETHFIISGLDTASFPVLDSLSVNKAWQNSMGFANHTFYESYEHSLAQPVQSNPYFAYLADKNGSWIDSHWLGIDGPQFYFDENKNLHLLILSFERHAIVGHYSFEL